MKGCVNGVQISVTHPDLQHSVHVVATESYYGYLVFSLNGPLSVNQRLICERIFHAWASRRLTVVWGNSYREAQRLRTSEWTGTLVWRALQAVVTGPQLTQCSLHTPLRLSSWFQTGPESKACLPGISIMDRYSWPASQ